MKKLNVLDLFCGCGGLSKGLEDSGLHVVAGIDIWDKAISNYKKNFKHLAICEDLTKFPPEKFDEIYNKDTKSNLDTKVKPEYKIPIDILVGGPSCQSFSMAGKRDPNDPRSSLFMEYVKYLDYFKPKAFIMENVIGILSAKTAKNEKVIDLILKEFNKEYNTIVCKLYASDFEVPQNRRRTIIFGIRKDLKILPTEPEVVSKIRPPVKTVLLPREEFDKLPDAKKYYLSEKALQGIKNRKEKQKEKGNGFGAQILDLDKPSYTISSRYYKDGSDALVKYSDTEIRRLCILELKRIQSFPDDFILEGSKKDIIMQIGNAVACKFAYHLGKHIQNLLNTKK